MKISKVVHLFTQLINQFFHPSWKTYSWEFLPSFCWVEEAIQSPNKKKKHSVLLDNELDLCYREFTFG